MNGFIIGLVFGLAISAAFFTSMSTPNSVWKRDAVEHQAAHYEMNPKTGTTKFIWNQ